MDVYRIAFAAIVVSAAGCFGPSAYVDHTASDYLAQQIKASRNIPDPNARASAMAAIARSAAYREDFDHFNTAMRELRGDPRHDEVAAECATHMAEAGKPDVAKKLAKKIDDPTRKQELLDKIAGKADVPKPDTTAR